MKQHQDQLRILRSLQEQSTDRKKEPEEVDKTVEGSGNIRSPQLYDAIKAHKLEEEVKKLLETSSFLRFS